MKKIHLGIMVRYNTNLHPPFMESDYYRLLTLYAKKMNINITIFSPLSVQWNSITVRGYRYDPDRRKWVKGTYPLPTVLYDRIAYTNRKQIQLFHSQIQRLVNDHHCILLGKGLPGKWIVYNMIKDHPNLKPYLPETRIYKGNRAWLQQLKTYGALFFKPASGSQGRGVFLLYHHANRFKVHGRDRYNHLFQKEFTTIKGLNAWIQLYTGSRTYIYQPYLELTTQRRQPFDIRVLVQKNHVGKWQETGRAVRVGKKHSVTSNLDGGGTAVDTDAFLTEHFTTTQIQHINNAIEEIVRHLPYQLEDQHGPLVELGIDIGIDRNQHVWILEVNSKPGRKAFQLSQNQNAFESALITPVQYAKYMVSQSGGHP